MSEHEKKVPECWPVVLERPLTPPQRRRWRRFRDPGLVPTLPPGCVYVFTGGDRPVTYPDLSDLRGDEPAFVAAKWVSGVSTRSRRIAIWTRVPTTEAAVAFTVGVWFGCQVDDPAAAAANGPFDLRDELQNQLRYTLAASGETHRHRPEDLGAARTATIDALTRAYSADPPSVPGMRLTFVGAVLEAPRELVRHQAELRDTAWTRLEQREKHEAERERVERTELDLLCTPERTEATAVTREQRTADQAAVRQFQERDSRLDRLAAQVKDWLDSDQAKRAPIDRRELAEALFARLLDEPSRAAARESRTGLVEPREPSNGRVPSEVLHGIAPATFEDDEK